MKLIVLSDIHTAKDNAEKALRNEEYDVAISLGETQLSDDWVEANFDYAVRGNNDFYSNLPLELEFEIGKFKFYITHGHILGSYAELENKEFLQKQLKNRNTNFILFGHTHKSLIVYSKDKKENKAAINPGSIGPKDFRSLVQTYCCIEINEKLGTIKDIKIKTLN